MIRWGEELTVAGFTGLPEKHLRVSDVSDQPQPALVVEGMIATTDVAIPISRQSKLSKDSV